MVQINDRGNRFSWCRVAELAAYNAPIVGHQMLIYLGISAICAVLTLLPLPGGVQFGIFTMIWTLLQLLFYLTPLALAKNGDSRIIDRMIPARPDEKFVFYLLYTLVAAPLAIYMLPTLACRLYTLIPTIQHETMLELMNPKFNVPTVIIGINFLSGTAIVLTCLYVVLHARSGRIVKGIVSVFAAMFATGLIGAIYGLSAIFRQGFLDGMSGARPDPDRVMMLTMNQMNMDTTLNVLIYTIYVAYIIWVLVQTYRTISRRNL